MSYCAETIDSYFCLPSEKVQAARESLLACLEERGRTFSEGVSSSFKALLEEVGLEVYCVGAGSEYDTIYFQYGRYNRDLVQGALRSIAAYVESGSYMVWKGEDSLIWVNAFDGQTCLEKTFCDFGLFAEKMISDQAKVREDAARGLEEEDLEKIADRVIMPDPKTTDLGSVLEDMLLLSEEGIERMQGFGEIDFDVFAAANRQLTRIRKRIRPEEYSGVALDQVLTLVSKTLLNR